MDDESIRIRAELEGALARDLNVAAEGMDELGDEAEETALQLRIMEAAAAGASREVRKLDRNTRTAAQRLDDFEYAFMGITEAVEDNTDALKDNEKQTKKTTSATKSLFDMLNRFSGKSDKFNFATLFKIYKWPAIATGLALIATGISGLSAAAVAAVAGVGPLTYLLGGIPSLATAAVQGIGTIKLGFKGIKDAVKALGEGDPEKIRKALAGLTAEGVVLASMINTLVKGPIKSLRESTQTAIAPHLVRALRETMPLWPVLERGTTRTAHTLGQLAEDAADVMSTPFFTGQLARVMRSNDRALRLGGDSAIYWMQSAFGLADAFRPVQIEMSRYLRNASKYIAVNIDAANRSGELTAAFERSWELAKAVGRVIRDLAVGIYNTGKAAGVLGDELGASLEHSASAWRKWTESLAGQATLEEWFAESIPVVQQVLGLTKDLIKALANMSNRQDFAPLIAQIRTDLLPIFDDFTASLGNDFGPAVVIALGALLKFLTFMSSSPLVGLVMTLARGVDMLASFLLALPGPIKFVIAVGMGLVFMMGLLARAMAVVKGTALGSFFAQMATGWQKGTNGARGYRAALQGVQGAAVGARMAAGGLFTAMGGPWMVALLAATAAIGAYSSAKAKQKALTDGFINSLNAESGALTAASQAWASQALIDHDSWTVSMPGQKDALRAAQELGLNMGQVTAAAQGNEEALAAVRAQLAGLDKEAGMLNVPGSDDWWIKSNVDQVSSALDSASDAASKGKAQFDAIKQAEQEAARQAGIHALAVRGTTNEMSTATAKAAGFTRAELGLKDVVKGTKFELEGQARATKKVYENQLMLNSLLEDTSTYVNFRQAVADTAKVLDKGKKTLDLHTQAGRDNWNALKDLATAADQVKDAAKRQEALKEARRKIQAWAESADIAKGRAKNLWKEFIVVDEKARAVAEAIAKLDRTDANIVITESGLDAIITKADRALGAMSDLVASQGQVQYQAVPTGKNKNGNPARRDGGPVWRNQRFTVGEEGRELFIGASGLAQIIGAGGRESRTFNESGFVLPHDRTEALLSAPEAKVSVPEAAPPSPVVVQAPTGGDTGPVEVEVHVHFDGAGTPTAEDARRLAREAAAEAARELAERGIGGSPWPL